MHLHFIPLPHMPVLSSCNSEANKDLILKILTKGGIQFSDLVENIVGKEEIAHNGH